MPKISFKRQRRSVRLVRHRYSPAAKRGVAVPVGSVMLDAAPEDVPACIDLCASAVLSPDDVARVREWLRAHGDPDAAKRRREMEQRIEARVQAEMARRSATPPLEEAIRALQAAAAAVSDMADSARARGLDPWDGLRWRYIAVYRAWTAFQAVAQSAGVAKTSKRAKRAG